MVDGVREASGLSGIHIIVVQQIQTILKLGGKWFERMIRMRKTKVMKKTPEDIINNHWDRDLFYSCFKTSFTSSTCPSCCLLSLPV